MATGPDKRVGCNRILIIQKVSVASDCEIFSCAQERHFVAKIAVSPQCSLKWAGKSWSWQSIRKRLSRRSSL
jgi:hypothetical protein